MNKNIINYANIASVALLILGRLLHSAILWWIGLILMGLLSIWTLIHWKENNQTSNYIAIAVLILVVLCFFGF